MAGASAMSTCTRCGEVKAGDALVARAGAVPPPFVCYDCKRKPVEAAQEEIKAELVGAPPALAKLQDKAHRAHGTLLTEELEVICGENGLVGIWRRGELIDGSGPTPTYYYNYAGATVVNFSGQA